MPANSALARALGTLVGCLALLVPGPTAAAASDSAQSAPLLALSERIYPVMDAPTPSGISWCRVTNPTCAPATWWQEHDQAPSDDLVQFSYLEPGMATESRYAEAIALLSLWSEGQFLLHQAAVHGVAVVTWSDGLSGAALASYTGHF